MKKLNSSEAGKIGGLKSAKITAKKLQQRIEKYNLNPSLCKFCNSVIPYKKRNNKFCSHSCAASYNNKGVGRNIKNSKHIKKQCEICGKETNNLKFCSRECFNKDREQQIEQKIISGNYSSLSTNKTLYKFLIQHRSHKCEQCQNSTWQGEDIPLTVHHIDGDASNNTLSNLKLLCWNCHALTPNYGRKNKNSTRNYIYILPRMCNSRYTIGAFYHK